MIARLRALLAGALTEFLDAIGPHDYGDEDEPGGWYL